MYKYTFIKHWKIYFYDTFIFKFTFISTGKYNSTTLKYLHENTIQGDFRPKIFSNGVEYIYHPSTFPPCFYLQYIQVIFLKLYIWNVSPFFCGKGCGKIGGRFLPILQIYTNKNITLGILYLPIHNISVIILNIFINIFIFIFLVFLFLRKYLPSEFK